MASTVALLLVLVELAHIARPIRQRQHTLPRRRFKLARDMHPLGSVEAATTLQCPGC